MRMSRIITAIAASVVVASGLTACGGDSPIGSNTLAAASSASTSSTPTTNPVTTSKSPTVNPTPTVTPTASTSNTTGSTAGSCTTKGEFLNPTGGTLDGDNVLDVVVMINRCTPDVTRLLDYTPDSDRYWNTTMAKFRWNKRVGTMKDGPIGGYNGARTTTKIQLVMVVCKNGDDAKKLDAHKANGFTDLGDCTDTITSPVINVIRNKA
jgi:hypothetical protein